VQFVTAVTKLFTIACT